MADSSTIKEFLVSLGFRTDEASLKKFEQGIATATKAAIGFAAAVEAMALAAAIAVTKLASNLEALYFASIRTGSAASNLKALDMAAQNFGASAGEALASVEGLAHALRINPANENLIQSLGVQTRDAKGNLRDMTDILVDLGKAFAARPMYQSEQYASLLGINEKTLLAMQNPGFGAMVEHEREIAKGFEASAAAAHEFEKELRDITLRFDAIKAQIALGLFKDFKPQLEELATWLQTHQKEIEDGIVAFAKAVATIGGDAIAVVRALTRAYQALLDVATKLGTVFANYAPKQMVDAVGNSINGLLHALGLISDAQYNEGHAYYENTYGSGNNNPGNLKYAGQAGASPGWFGSRFAHFGSTAEGLDALARQLQLYAQRGNDTISGIISKYAPAGENDTAGYIAYVAKALGVRAGSELDLNDPNTLAMLMKAIVRREGNDAGVNDLAIRRAAENADPSGRPLGFADTSLGRWLADLADNVEAASAARNIHAPQTTNITVHGTGDANSTAGAVAREQARVNSELIRNFGDAIF